MQQPMTAEQRRAEFNRIFEALPGRNIDRIRVICKLIHYKENYVRILRLKTENARVIPEAKLLLLKKELSRSKKYADVL